ncbi:MAG: chemotaxis protein CheW [Rickettsiales bacterium]|nr:chemotaxis protein CheW [Rickettsiales bacterium]
MKENALQVAIEQEEQFLTLRVAGQLFGIPVLKVRDVLKPQRVTKIPKVRSQILGLMNLRGRIVTVINMSETLGVTCTASDKKKMFVVVDHENEYYSLSVDEVGQTITLKLSEFEKNPANLTKNWRDFSKGVFKLEKELMLVLDIPKVITI